MLRKNRIPSTPWLFLPLALLTLAVPVSAQDPLEKILRKLDEIERRLSKLEQEKQAGKERESLQPGEPSQAVDVSNLQKEVDVLSEELEKLRSGEEDLEISAREARSRGLAPSASSVYRKQQGVALAGYGEMLYQNFDDENQLGDPVSMTTELDFLRAIVYAGYRFNDRFVFNSEIEFEHASTAGEGSASVEFAYLDYIANDYLTLRGGLLLVPMGLVNEFHEPNVFVGALRPEVERRILPTTWRENGAGILGSAGIFDYRAYVINGLDGTGFSSNGLRGGRQRGSEALASDLAFVGRLDVHPFQGFFLGGSFYRGGSDQGRVFVGDRQVDLTTTIGEVHAQFQRRGLDIRGLFARASLDDVAAFNEAMGLTGSSSLGEVLQGGYFHVGYDVLNRFSETKSLLPFYRFEGLNTQSQVPDGFAADPARDRTFHTFGLEFKPISNVVLKADYRLTRNNARTGVNQFNLKLGYSF